MQSRKSIPDNNLWVLVPLHTMYLGENTKLGLSQGFKTDVQIQTYIKQLMAIPFLPASLITPTYSCLQLPMVNDEEKNKLEKLQKYYKHWIRQITPAELTINEINFATNNAAESYHSKLKSIIRNTHPRIWTFMASLNNIIMV